MVTKLCGASLLHCTRPSCLSQTLSLASLLWVVCYCSVVAPSRPTWLRDWRPPQSWHLLSILVEDLQSPSGAKHSHVLTDCALAVRVRDLCNLVLSSGKIDSVFRSYLTPCEYRWFPELKSAVSRYTVVRLIDVNCCAECSTCSSDQVIQMNTTICTQSPLLHSWAATLSATTLVTQR